MAVDHTVYRTPTISLLRTAARSVLKVSLGFRPLGFRSEPDYHFRRIGMSGQIGASRTLADSDKSDDQILSLLIALIGKL